MILNEIIQAIYPLQVIGDADNLQSFDIRHLLTDSRQLSSEPEATLFFAIKTEKNDGAKYVPELIERGVRAFVISSVRLEINHYRTQEAGHEIPLIFILVECKRGKTLC